MNRVSAPRLRFVLAASLLVAIAASPSAQAADDAQQAPQIQVFDSGTLSVPKEWKRTQVQSSIIEHEFSVSAKDDAEQKARITMMAAGGSVEDNINRWKGQFTGGDAEAQKVEKIEAGGNTIHMVDVSGTFTERMGGGGPFAGGKVVQRPDYAMVGAIIVTPERRQYFVKMTGPQKVVQENREAFAKMVKGISKER